MPGKANSSTFARGENRRPSRRCMTVAVLLAGLWMGGWGCAGQDGAMPAAVADAAHYFPVGIGRQQVMAQLAVTNEEAQRGLMGRRQLAPDHGMLFVYAEPQQLSFWMANTPLPLDIGFFTADGTLVEIYALKPFDTTVVASRSRSLRFALEVNRGWFAAHRIAPGARLDLAAVERALAARGVHVNLAPSH